MSNLTQRRKTKVEKNIDKMLCIIKNLKLGKQTTEDS